VAYSTINPSFNAW